MSFPEPPMSASMKSPRIRSKNPHAEAPSMNGEERLSVVNINM